MVIDYLGRGDHSSESFETWITIKFIVCRAFRSVEKLLAWECSAGSVYNSNFGQCLHGSLLWSCYLFCGFFGFFELDSEQSVVDVDAALCALGKVAGVVSVSSISNETVVAD